MPVVSRDWVTRCELSEFITVWARACPVFTPSPLDGSSLYVPGSLLAESNRAKPAGAMLSGWAAVGSACSGFDCRSPSQAGGRLLVLGKLPSTATGLASSASVMRSCSQLSPVLLAVTLLASAPLPSPLFDLSLLRALLLPVPEAALKFSLLTCPAAMGLVSSDACSLASLASSHTSKSSCMETPSGHTGS